MNKEAGLLLAADLNFTTLAALPSTPREVLIRTKTFGLSNPFLSNSSLPLEQAKKLQSSTIEDILPDMFATLEPVLPPLSSLYQSALEGWRAILDVCGLRFPNYSSQIYQKRAETVDKLEQRRLRLSLSGDLNHNPASLQKDQIERYVAKQLPLLLRNEKVIQSSVFFDSFYLHPGQYSGMKILTRNNQNLGDDKKNHIVIVSSSPAEYKELLTQKIHKEGFGDFLSPLLWALIRLDDTVSTPQFKAVANRLLHEMALRLGVDHEGYEDDFVPAIWNSSLFNMRYHIVRPRIAQILQQRLLPPKELQQSRKNLYYSSSYIDIAQKRGLTE